MWERRFCPFKSGLPLIINRYSFVGLQKLSTNGTIAACVTIGWTNNGKQIKKYLGSFATRQEALNALANFNQNPYDVDLRKLTFAEVYERWCQQKFKGEPVKRVYVAAYKNLSPLHEMIFARIRKRHIQAVIDNCPLKVQAKGHMKTVCSQMFKYAIDMEIVATNFALLVELPIQEDSEIHKPARYMRGGIKTAAGKNRVIPITEKIVPFVEGFYNPANEYLLTINGKAVLIASRQEKSRHCKLDFQ